MWVVTEAFLQKNILSIEPHNNNNKYYLFDPNPKVKNYIKELTLNKNINYFELALDNSNQIKKFTINKFFEPQVLHLNHHIKDKLYNLSRRIFFFNFFNLFQKYRIMKQ